MLTNNLVLLQPQRKQQFLDILDLTNLTVCFTWVSVTVWAGPPQPGGTTHHSLPHRKHSLIVIRVAN